MSEPSPVFVNMAPEGYVDQEAATRSDADAALDLRLDAVEDKIPSEASASNKLADKAYVATQISNVVDSAPAAFDTLKEIADWIGSDQSGAQAVINQVAGKKDKQTAVSDPSASGTSITFIDSISQNANGEITPTKKTVAEAVASSSGVGGSAGLMTGAEKEKLAGVAAGAEVNVQSDWSQADTTASDYIKNKPSIPSASTAAPQMDGTASAGSSGSWAKGDHVHPRDTSKLDGVAVYPRWGEAVPYGAVGTIVSWNGRLWRNNAQTMGDEPGVSAYWDEVFLKDVKADAYDFSAVQTISSAGTELSPNEVTPVDAQNKRVSVTAANAYIAVALPAASANGHIRDLMLTLDCSTLSDGDEPNVTWASGYVEANADSDNLAADAAAVNVYYVTEYAEGAFLVARQTISAGGDA